MGNKKNSNVLKLTKTIAIKGYKELSKKEISLLISNIEETLEDVPRGTIKRWLTDPENQIPKRNLVKFIKYNRNITRLVGLAYQMSYEKLNERLIKLEKLIKIYKDETLT